MVRIKGIGPVYVGWEAWSDEPKVVSRAWLIELTPPWRKGRGLRFRVGHRALQVGLCHRELAPDPTPLSQLGGHDLDFSPQQIGAWGRDAAPEGPDPAA